MPGIHCSCHCSLPRLPEPYLQPGHVSCSGRTRTPCYNSASCYPNSYRTQRLMPAQSRDICSNVRSRPAAR